jgi:hypothetical protein
MNYTQFKLHNYLENYRKNSNNPRKFITILQNRINESSIPTYSKLEYNNYLKETFNFFKFDILADKKLLDFNFDMSFDGNTNEILEHTPGEIKKLFSFFPTEEQIITHKIALKKINFSFKDMLDINFQTFAIILKTFDVYEDNFEKFSTYFINKIQYQDTTLINNDFENGIHIITTKNLLNYVSKSHLNKESAIIDFFRLFIGSDFNAATPIEFNILMQQIFKANKFGKYDLNLDVTITDLQSGLMIFSDSDFLKFKNALPSIEIIYSLVRQMLILGMTLEDAFRTKFYENVIIWEKMNYSI